MPFAREDVTGEARRLGVRSRIELFRPVGLAYLPATGAVTAVTHRYFDMKSTILYTLSAVTTLES